MGFVGNYAPRGLSPQTDGMPVIQKQGTYQIYVPWHFISFAPIPSFLHVVVSFIRPVILTVEGLEDEMAASGSIQGISELIGKVF